MKILKLKKLVRIELYLLVLSIPFELYLSINVGFTLKPAHVFATLAALTMVITWVSKGKIPRSTVTLFVFLCFWIIPILLSMINISSKEIFKSQQGSLRMLFNFFYLYLILISVTFISDTFSLKKFILMFLIGTNLSVIIELLRLQLELSGIIVDKGRYWLPAGFPRLHPSNMPPNQYANIIGLAIIFYIAEFFWPSHHKKWSLRILYLYSFALLLTGLVMTYTRIIWFGVMIVVSFFILLSLLQGHYKKVILSLLLMLICAILLLTLDMIEPIWNRIMDTFNLEFGSNLVRIYYWKNSINYFYRHPFIGNGWATNLTPHSVYLQILSETGFIGFIVFIFFLNYNFLTVLHVYKNFVSVQYLQQVGLYIIGVFILIMVYLAVDIGFFQIQTWVFLGLIIACSNIKIHENIYTVR